tara:strand:- start:313 stop:837 length:525 start_codon:yes stop_codon:yes gene_type:complete
MKWFNLLFIALFIHCGIATNAHALPSSIATNYPNLQAIGEYNYSYFFLDVYNIKLYQTKDTSDIQALDIKYQRDLSAGRRLSKAVEDLEKQENVTPLILKKWEKQMKAIFPDVVKGDHITILKHDIITSFYHNEKLQGSIKDPAFTSAFFNVWVGKEAPDKNMRYRLLEGAFYK